MRHRTNVAFHLILPKHVNLQVRELLGCESARPLDLRELDFGFLLFLQGLPLYYLFLPFNYLCALLLCLFCRDAIVDPLQEALVVVLVMVVWLN